MRDFVTAHTQNITGSRGSCRIPSTFWAAIESVATAAGFLDGIQKVYPLVAALLFLLAGNPMVQAMAIRKRRFVLSQPRNWSKGRAQNMSL
jgi:uncharacterized membrane protein YkvI